MTISLRERFEDKVELIPFSTCHWWTAYRNNDGYGCFSKGGEPVKAHRVAYELYVGVIPDGKIVCHSCDEPSCVNPEHLWVGTDMDNTIDKVSKGRQAKHYGEKNGSSKLTSEQVLTIRSMAGTATQQSMADFYGVSDSLVNMIINRKIWKQI